MTTVDYLLNRLLLKQVQKKYGSIDYAPPEVAEFLSTISQTYDQYERERQLLERAMDLSNQEMIDANSRLEKQKLQLERRNEELQEFAYAVSHDLKEPLRTIAGYVQLTEVRLKQHLDGETKEFMDFAVAGVKRLQTMLDGMLKYAQIDGEHHEFGKTSLQTVVEIAIEDLKEEIRQCKAQINIPNQLPEIHGNKILMIQLFSNLISNSLKFRSGQQPVIEIGFLNRNDDYLLWISDNGIGISNADQRKLFTMFGRGHSRDFDGVGMGLSICKKIVENHGGEINVVTDLESGFTVQFTFPKS
ncbi:MAG TPA: ATP-binding protein [Chitinophagales bacterium]|nr:ATP-binding protein [Chitinophagales bacterium]